MTKDDVYILIVEDEWVNSEFLKQVVEKLGFKNIFISTNFEDAKKIVQEYKINIIFMDINIKGSIDGVQSAHILNNIYPIPIVYTTAYTDSNTIADASDTNIYGYLIKPFNEKDIEASINIVLKRVYSDYTDHSSSYVLLTNGYRYNPHTKILTIDNVPIKLTKIESMLLDLLYNNIDKITTLDELRITVWKDCRFNNKR